MIRFREDTWPSWGVQEEVERWRWEKGSSLVGDDSFPQKKAWRWRRRKEASKSWRMRNSLMCGQWNTKLRPSLRTGHSVSERGRSQGWWKHNRDNHRRWWNQRVPELMTWPHLWGHGRGVDMRKCPRSGVWPQHGRGQPATLPCRCVRCQNRDSCKVNGGLEIRRGWD